MTHRNKTFHRLMPIALLIASLVPPRVFADVNPLSGAFTTRQTDLLVRFHAIEIDVFRSYDSLAVPQAQKTRWHFHPFHKQLLFTQDGGKVFLRDGPNLTLFERSGKEDVFLSRSNERISKRESEFVRTLTTGVREVYNAKGKLLRILRPDGKVLKLSYHKDVLAKILLNGTELLHYVYNREGSITQIRTYNGSSSSYRYDGKGFLKGTTNADNMVTSYAYDDRGRLNRISYQTGDFLNIEYHRNTGIVKSITKRDGITSYAYKRDKTGKVGMVTISLPAGIQEIDITSDGRLIRSIDASGNVTERHYDHNGLLTRFVDAKGNRVAYTYDADHRLVEIRYPDNSTVRYAYLGETSFVTTKTLQDGSEIALTYNDKAQVIKAAGPGDGEISYRYNRLGLVDAIYYGKNERRWTKYKYDARGFMVVESDALGRTIRYKRDGKGRMVERIDALGRRVKYTYNKYGFLTGVSDSSRVLFAKTYDEKLRLLQLTDASGLSMRFAYDQKGNLASVVYPNGRKETYQYNEYGWLQSVHDSRGRRSSYDYNPLGEVSKWIAPDGATTAYRYDPLGNVLELQEPNGYAIRWEYDPMGRVAGLVRPGGMNHEYTYDSSGQLVAERDATGHGKNYFYDPSGSLARVLLPNGEQTSYKFDPAGFLESARTADGREYRYAYDRAGRLIREQTPWGELIEYSYDKADRLVKKTSSGGDTTEYSYDAADRLIMVKTSDGLLETFTYDPRGRLVEIRGKDFVKKLSYNLFGELIAEEHPLLGKTVKYTYDSRGNRLSLEVPGHVKINYSYDGADRLISVTYDGGKKITIAYDALGRKSEISYPNGVRIRYSYDKLNLLEGIIYRGHSGNVIQRYSYAHDKNGRVKRISDLNGNVRVFAYDANGQLIEAAAKNEKITFAYGESFKRVLERKGSQATPFVYNPAGQLIKAGKTRVTYDDSGNLSRKHGPGMDQRFRFNAVGRLTQVETPSQTVAYNYSPEGQRVRKQIGKTKTYYVYDGVNLLMVLDKERQPVRTLIHAGEIDSPLAVLEGDHAFFYLRDHQGSTIGLVDEKGEITAEYEYAPFGKMTVRGKETDHPLTYTGRFYDEETGLYYYRARYYDPKLGIFLSPDPYPKSLASPQGFSEYAYVYNDPMNLVDPLGLNGYSHMWNVLERAGHATPHFLQPIILRPESATSPSFWQKMAEDYAFLHKEFGRGTAENFRRQLTKQLAKLYKPQTPKPGILGKVYEGAKGLLNRVGQGVKAIGQGIRGGGDRIAQGVKGLLNRGVQRAPTLAGASPKGPLAGNATIDKALRPAGAAGTPTGYSALTEGKSSFQKPSLLGRTVTELNRPVTGGEIGGGVLTSVLVGWQVGSRYAEQARREGRNLTPGEYAKSAGESAVRAVAAVATLGASEGLINIGELGSEVLEGRKASKRAEEAQKAYERAQRMAAERIRAFADQAASLVQEVGAMEKDQGDAIAEAKSWYQQTEQKLEEMKGFQAIADNKALCRQCNSKVTALNSLQAEAESFREPVTGNRDIAKQRANLVCPPVSEGTAADVDMASSAAGLAKGQAGAIKRIADNAKSLQSEIGECTAKVQANNDAIANAESTLQKVEGIKAAVASNKAKVEQASVRVKSFVGKCRTVQGRISRIHGIAQASPDIVWQVTEVSADGPHEITTIDTGPAKQQIANAVTQINEICNRISSKRREGEIYVGHHDAVEQSIQAKAQTLEAKIKETTPCTVESPPQGLVENLNALAGAAEVLAAYAETDANRAVQCLAQATKPPQEPGEETRTAEGGPGEEGEQPSLPEGWTPGTDPGMGGGTPLTEEASEEAGKVTAGLPQGGGAQGEGGGGLGGAVGPQGEDYVRPSDTGSTGPTSPETTTVVPEGGTGQADLGDDFERDRPKAGDMISRLPTGREPTSVRPSPGGPPVGGSVTPPSPTGTPMTPTPSSGGTAGPSSGGAGITAGATPRTGTARQPTSPQQWYILKVSIPGTISRSGSSDSRCTDIYYTTKLFKKEDLKAVLEDTRRVWARRQSPGIRSPGEPRFRRTWRPDPQSLNVSVFKGPFTKRPVDTPGGRQC